MERRLLVVDDDPVTRQILGAQLQASHYETVFAVDAITAVSVAKRSRPDLVLLDIGLPGGDALLVMERFRGIPELASMPVIIISARDPDLYKERVLAAGAQAFFHKPYKLPSLLAAIERALAERDRAQQEH